MSNVLFNEIDKFKEWAQTHYNIPQNEIGGEWECNYPNWDKIYTSFEKFMSITPPNDWTKIELHQLLYIIARDNEIEHLVSLLSDTAIIILTEESVLTGERDNKWQLAIQLHKLSNKQTALWLLEKLVNDEDEYVNKRSLMELAKLQSTKIDFYAELFWNRNTYGDLDEYQKMAVLFSLNTVHAKSLNHYIQLAKADGRKYLLDAALKIETENQLQ